MSDLNFGFGGRKVISRSKSGYLQFLMKKKIDEDHSHPGRVIITTLHLHFSTSA